MVEHTIHPSSPGLQSPPAPQLAARRLQGLRNLMLVIYLLYGLSLFTGLPVLLALVMNYVRLDESRGTLYRSHFSWTLRTFWWGLLWSVLGLSLVIAAFAAGGVTAANIYVEQDYRAFAVVSGIAGGSVLGFTWLWTAYRLLRGLLNWNDYREMPG